MSKIKTRHMLVNYVQKPKYPNKTHEKGYWSNPDNIQWDEAVEFSLGLKRNDVAKYSIIMDIDNQTVVKNSINGEKNFAVLFGYYKEHYYTQIFQYLNRTEHLVVQPAPAAN